MSEIHDALQVAGEVPADSVETPLTGAEVPADSAETPVTGAEVPAFPESVALEGDVEPVTDELVAEEPVAEEEVLTFASFGFCAELLQGIKEAGFVEPTLIQAKAIPDIMVGRDIIGQALTGSGKTAAFGLPAMERIRGKSGLRFLVLVPTRELAAQVSSELFKLGHHTGVRTAAFTGGQSYYRQEQLLRQGVNALVATPGRLIDLMDNGHFADVNPEVIVVDEADEMLDMGFLDDVKKIFDFFPGPRQTMLFSATMPRQVVELARKVLQNPVDISASITQTTNNDIEQQFYVIEEHERVNAVIRLIDSDDVSKAIIFCRTREETDALNILLGGRGYNVNCLHGDMEQAQRSRVMAAFRRGDIDILVATDVAARGLDVEDVTHVFNFHMPFDSRGYVHRIGRTGRAGKSGKAITLVTPRELRQLEAIKRSVGADIQVGEIPTRQEVLAQRLQRVLAELFANDLDPQLYSQVRKLAEGHDQDSLVLFTKLLSKYLASSSDQGPETIGISGDRLERLITGRGRREERYGDRRGGRDGRYGDRRGGYERDRRPGGPERGAGGPERGYRRDEHGPAAGREERPPRREVAAAAEGSAAAAPDKAVYQQRNEQGLSLAQRIAAEINRGEKAPRSEYDQAQGQRPERRFEGERPPRFGGGEARPERRFEGERPPRFGGGEARPERRFEGERPPRFGGGEARPERRFEGERPPRFGGGEARPERPTSGDHKPARFDRHARFDGQSSPKDRFQK